MKEGKTSQSSDNTKLLEDGNGDIKEEDDDDDEEEDEDAGEDDDNEGDNDEDEKEEGGDDFEASGDSEEEEDDEAEEFSSADEEVLKKAGNCSYSIPVFTNACVPCYLWKEILQWEIFSVVGFFENPN